jgi:polysaccharide export outer membrane protein
MMRLITVLSGLFLIATGAGGREPVFAARCLVLPVPEVWKFTAKDKEVVKVLGQVNKPAAIPWEKGLTLSKVIAKAGGLTKLANTKQVSVTRNGKTVRHDLGSLKKKGIDPPILPGDIVAVAERYF